MNICFPYNHLIPTKKYCLICFPHSGAGASIYQPWKKFLPDEIEVMAVQLPGRESRYNEPCHSSIHTIIQEFLDKIDIIRTKNKIALFGHSLGASIAFECARRLKDPGIKTFISSGKAPNIKKKKIHNLPDQSFLYELSRYGGLPKMLMEEQELQDLFLPLLRADLAIAENYSCDDSCKVLGDLILISGRNDPVVEKSDLDGWKILTKGKFSHHVVPGNHFYHQTFPQYLLNIIIKYLNV